MKTVDPLNLVKDLEARIEISIRTAVQTFQNLPTSTLLKPSKTGGWSISQCLEHLNSYGDFYLPHIKTALEKNALLHSEDSFKSSWIGKYFIQMMLPNSPRKYKAVKKHIPKHDLDAIAIVAAFIHQQELLLLYLEMAKRANLNTIKIPISIVPFIKLKLGDTFQFIITHNERHIEQAKRNI